MSGLLSRAIIAAANATVPAPGKALDFVRFFSLSNVYIKMSAEEDSAYGYTPTQYVCYIFVVLFGLSTRA
jgi:hypothetical protein